MKNLALILLITVSGFAAFSQQQSLDSISRSRIESFIQIQSAAMVGCNACSNGKEISFSGTTKLGIKVARKWRTAMSVGLDSYFEWNIIPIFGTLSWDVIGKKNKLYAEFNYGGALVSWRNSNYWEYGLKDTSGGRMYSYGIGYRLNYDKVNFSIGIGHKTQWVTTYYEYPTYYWDVNNYVIGDPTRRTVKTELNRMMIWFAFGWQ